MALPMPLMRWIWPENGPIPTIDGKKSKKIPERRKSRLYKEASLHHIPAPMTPLFAAVDWLNISINLLLVIHVIICLLLALLVLMQRPKQEGLGAAFGSGLTDQAFGARTTDVLQKGTVYLGTLFFVVTLVLAILIGKRQSANPSMADTSADATEEITPADAAPVLPADVTPVVMPETEAPVETPVETPAETPTEPEVPAETPAETPAEPATGDNQ
jgi:preprotein translocase subunit SecG